MSTDQPGNKDFDEEDALIDRLMSPEKKIDMGLCGEFQHGRSYSIREEGTFIYKDPEQYESDLNYAMELIKARAKKSGKAEGEPTEGIHDDSAEEKLEI